MKIETSLQEITINLGDRYFSLGLYGGCLEVEIGMGPYGADAHLTLEAEQTIEVMAAFVDWIAALEQQATTQRNEDGRS